MESKQMNPFTDLHFDERKIEILNSLTSMDKSKKGSVDLPIEDLIRFINEKEDMITTSSCSGRVMLILEVPKENKKPCKKGGEWVYSSHDIPDASKISCHVQDFWKNQKEKCRLEFTFDPFILAVDCRNIECANRLLAIGRNCGFRESGIVFGKGKIHTTIRSNSRFQITLAESNNFILDQAYIDYVINSVIEKFNRNSEKVKKFTEELNIEFSLKSQSISKIQNGIYEDGTEPLIWESSQYEYVRNRLNRWAHGCCVLENGDIILFGGYGGEASHQRLNDIIQYNPKQCAISKPTLKGTIPEPVMGHTLTAVGNLVFVIGGRKNPDLPLNDIFVLNTDSWEFSKLKNDTDQHSEVFPPRFRHSANLVKPGYLQFSANPQILIFGGCGEGPNKALSDLWLFDTMTHTFKKESISNGPCGRMSHASCIWQRALYLTGGFSDYGEIYDDLYKLDLWQMTWEKIETKSLSIRKSFSLNMVPLDDFGILIFGGCPDVNPTKIQVINPTTAKSRILKVQVSESSKLVPLRSTAMVSNGNVYVIGGGSFCFSFGSIFSSVHSLDINKLTIAFSTPKLQTHDIYLHGSNSHKDMAPALIVPKSMGKHFKDSLKDLKWLNKNFKARIVETNTKIAFPLTDPSYNYILENFREIEIEILKNVKSGDFFVQKVEFEFASESQKLCPAEQLKKSLLSILLRNGILKEKANLLMADVPTKWEMLGDMVLIPEDKFISQSWEKIGKDIVYNQMAHILGAKRIARQGRIANNGIRESRVSLLLGTDGWVRHVESGIIYKFDVTKCMFSSGNTSERIRMAKLDCQDETVVDLFTGIGYFTLPILCRTNTKKVFACEWNPQAIAALKRNLIENGVYDKCCILEGDCRKVAPKGIADRVLLGLLPSSEIAWETAIKALKPSGGWLHLHSNVIDKEEQSWVQQTLGKLKEFATDKKWDISIYHIERVKWYAPHIRHIVLDIRCQLTNTEMNQIPIHSHILQDEQPEKINTVTNIDREIFVKEIGPKRRPVLIKGMDIGDCVDKWTVQYLMSKEECQKAVVGVHVCSRQDGLMSFVDRNFVFHNMPLSELIQRCAENQKGTLQPLICPGEHYYLRTIGHNARKDPSDLKISFPELSQDIKIPYLFEQDAFFSSVLRVSTKGLRLWTHFDVMDNFLIQVTGSKKIRMWPPEAEPNLYIKGSSSEVVDIMKADKEKYPKFVEAEYIDVELGPGDVLFIPALWFHNVFSETYSISVNVFFKELPGNLYDNKDLYGNRDLIFVKETQELVGKIFEKYNRIPNYYKKFYGSRLVNQIKQYFKID